MSRKSRFRSPHDKRTRVSPLLRWCGAELRPLRPPFFGGYIEMAGGTQIIVISLLAIGVSFAAFRLKSARPALASDDVTAWGDVVSVPEELRPAREGKRGGDSSEQGGRADTHTVIAHDKGGK